MTSRVVTSWMAELGTSVDSRAEEMTFEMATNDSVDSLPPAVLRQLCFFIEKKRHRYL